MGDPDALRDPDSRPVRWVNWREALAYCAWLNEVLKTAPGFVLAEDLRNGRLRVTLPCELEWEKSARGGLSGKIFPWGDEPDANRANYSVTGLGTTSTVGCFPPNAYGICDMAGNGREACVDSIILIPPATKSARRFKPKTTDNWSYGVVRGAAVRTSPAAPIVSGLYPATAAAT